MSVWIFAAASSAVWPPRSVQARASVGPIVKKVIRPSASLSRSRDLLERRRAFAEGGGFLLGELGELGLELEVDSARAVLDDHHRLRRQRLERVRDLALVVGDRPTGLDVRQQRLEARRPPASASGRPTSPADAPARGASRRGRGRRRAARASASRVRSGIGARREAVEHRRAARPIWRRLPSSAGPVPGTSCTRIVAGVSFADCSTAASCSQPLVRDRRHADVRLRLVHVRAGVRERVEQRRLAGLGQPDDPDLERHGPNVPVPDQPP